MDSAETRALTHLTNRRFRSFSEAVDSVLAALDEAIPGTVMLGQLDMAEELCRVIDVRGGAKIHLRRGTTLPLAAITTNENTGSESNGDSGVTADGELDREFLRSLSVTACLTRHLEMSDGSIIGALCALDTDSGAYSSDHLVLLGVAARLLSYEWENVSRRAELRRLRESVRDIGSSDADTGLPNREGFLELLEREWRLSARGTVQSVLVACHVRVDGPEGNLGETLATLALKDAAELLSTTARSTDHVGRTGAMDLAAVLVGCHGIQSAEAFLRRFRAGVRRVTDGRATPISTFCSTQALAGSSSAREALLSAERAARETSAANDGGRGPHKVRTHE